MIAIDRIGCALRSIASQAPTCSSRRRGPSAIATVRKGFALGPAGAPGSTTATDAPCPIACLIAAASAKPDAPPPAMTTSKTGAGSAIADASFRPIVGRIRCSYRLLRHGAISEFGFHLFKGLRRHFPSAARVCGRQAMFACALRFVAHEYSLTRIFVCADIENMNPETLAALGEPNRLRIVELLRAGPRPVNDIHVRLGLRQSQASQHLKVLKDVGLVEMEPRAQQRLYSLRAEPLKQLHDWLDRYRHIWEERFEALDEIVEELKQKEQSDAAGNDS